MFWSCGMKLLDTQTQPRSAWNKSYCSVFPSTTWPQRELQYPDHPTETRLRVKGQSSLTTAEYCVFTGEFWGRKWRRGILELRADQRRAGRRHGTQKWDFRKEMKAWRDLIPDQQEVQDSARLHIRDLTPASKTRADITALTLLLKSWWLKCAFVSTDALWVFSAASPSDLPVWSHDTHAEH